MPGRASRRAFTTDTTLCCLAHLMANYFNHLWPNNAPQSRRLTKCLPGNVTLPIYSTENRNPRGVKLWQNSARANPQNRQAATGKYESRYHSHIVCSTFFLFTDWYTAFCTSSFCTLLQSGETLPQLDTLGLRRAIKYILPKIGSRSVRSRQGRIFA